MKLNLSPVYTALPPSPISNQVSSGSEAPGRADNPPLAQEGRFVNPDYQNRFSGITPRFQQYPNQVIVQSILNNNHNRSNNW